MQIRLNERLAGVAAMAGGAAALALTLPFAAAYHSAYPGDALPFWYGDLRPRLAPVLTFDTSRDVYATYGRIYNLVYLLLIPLVVVLHRRHYGLPSGHVGAGYRLLMIGLVATTVGVAGDYWGDGIGFAVEVLGLLVMVVGVSVWGVGLLRTRVVPLTWAWLVTLCGPAAVASTVLVGHVPSGPTAAFAVVWVVLGGLMVVRTGRPAAPVTP